MYLSTAPLVGELSGADGAPFLAGLLVGHEVQDAITSYRRYKLSLQKASGLVVDAESSRQTRLAALASESGAAVLPSACADGKDSLPTTSQPVTLLGTQGPAGGLLPMYRLALERYGCNVEELDQPQIGEGQAMPAGLFAIGNSLSALEKQREAERQVAAAHAKADEAAPTTNAATIDMGR